MQFQLRNRDVDTEDKLVDRAGKETLGQIGRLGLTIYALPCAKPTSSRRLLSSTGNSAWCSVKTWRGGEGVGRERDSRRRGCMYAHSRFTSLQGRNYATRESIILQDKRRERPLSFLASLPLSLHPSLPLSPLFLSSH